MEVFVHLALQIQVFVHLQLLLQVDHSDCVSEHAPVDIVEMALVLQFMDAMVYFLVELLGYTHQDVLLDVTLLGKTKEPNQGSSGRGVN